MENNLRSNSFIENMHIERLSRSPIIHPKLSSTIGENVNGPSLIRAPPWIDNPLAEYYLYFAHHKGDSIRLAYSNQLADKWNIYEGGTLQLADSFFNDHIASPDVHVDKEARRVRMYYHGVTDNGQKTRVATSSNGIDFEPRKPILGPYYFRVFEWEGEFYAFARDGAIYRSQDPFSKFARGHELFEQMRHCAVDKAGDVLHVYYSNVGDAPERILRSHVTLEPRYKNWTATPSETVLEPEYPYEGAGEQTGPSKPGPVYDSVRQLRDPDIFVEGEDKYLLYTVAGESGIAIAKIDE